MNCSKGTGVKLLAELDTGKGIGLIERKKRGQGKPTIIYVKNFITCENVSISDSAISECQEAQKPEVQKSKNWKSEITSAELPEVQNMDTNYNNTNYNDLSYNNPTNQSEPELQAAKDDTNDMMGG